MAPQGAKKGAKWGKGAHLLTNSYKNLQIWLDMIFNMENMIVGCILRLWNISPLLGHPRGQKGHKMG